MRRSGSFFHELTPNNLGYGASLGLGIGVNVSPQKSNLAVHLGFQDRFNTGSTATHAYSINSVYGYARLEAAEVFMTFGVAPLIWKRYGTSAGIDGFERKSTALGALFEVGRNLPITPEVSFCISGVAEVIAVGTNYGPKPILAGVATLRFYIGKGPNYKKRRGYYGDDRDGPYEGYRYPYGNPK